MAKKVTGYLKLQVPAGAANPSPPIGPALGQRGLNIMEFCKAFNAQTQKMEKGSPIDRKSTRLNSSHLVISYAVFCLKKKKQQLRPRVLDPLGVTRLSLPRQQRKVPVAP